MRAFLELEGIYGWIDTYWLQANPPALIQMLYPAETLLIGECFL